MPHSLYHLKVHASKSVQVANRLESHHQYPLPKANCALHPFLLDWRKDYVFPLYQIT